MKKTFLLIVGLLSLIQVGFAQITSKVDERFELTSITFALAGVPQFCDCGIPSYWEDIKTEFTPFELTEPIHFVRELHQTHRISYDAVSTVACMLEIKNGKIKLNSKYDASKISEFDSRWNEELLTKYIKMLNVFYKESNFHQFFKDHQELYAIAEQRTNEHIAGTATEWFKSFFGKELDPDIKVYISLVNGPHNYAMPEGVLLGMGSDSAGLPAPGSGTISLLIHEIGHHYTNPLADKYWPEMEDAANKIYPHVREQMAKNAYGDARTTMVEWLNNLFVLMYLKESNSNVSGPLYGNLSRGFIWMERSVDFMDNFYANRDLYPSVEEFMPQLVSFLNFTADNFDFVKREIEFAQPYITNIYPALGSDITDAKEVIITFSEPMNGSYGFNGWPENAEGLWFDFDNSTWSEDMLQFKLKLTPGKRERGHTYGIKLHVRGFQSAKYFSLDEKCADIVFKPEY